MTTIRLPRWILFFFQMVKSFKSKSRYSKYISIHTRRIVGDVFVVVGDLLHFSKFLGFRSSHWPLGIFERRTHINYHNDLEMKLWLRFNETHYPHTQFVLIDCCQEVSCSAPFDDYVHLTWDNPQASNERIVIPWNISSCIFKLPGRSTQGAERRRNWVNGRVTLLSSWCFRHRIDRMWKEEDVSWFHHLRVVTFFWCNVLIVATSI